MYEGIMGFDWNPDKPAQIKVVGVGGGGSNAVTHMFNLGIKDVDFIICNTDSQALSKSPVPIKVQLGETLTGGRGAGNEPQVGKQAAVESIDSVIKAIGNNTNMVFITAGMGGGTGTGAAPEIAKAVKSLNILTVAIVTIPFRWEGNKRLNQAAKGLAEMAENVDAMIVIDNDKLCELTKDFALTKAFSEADNVLAVAAKSIAEIITVEGHVNVDFADVNTVMKNSGIALMGSAIANGPDRALDAVKQALTSPLLNNNDIYGTKKMLLNIVSGSEEITMNEIRLICNYVQDKAGNSADLIWGNTTDDKLGEKIRVTLIATGFEPDNIPGIPLITNDLFKNKAKQETPGNDAENIALPDDSDSEFSFKDIEIENIDFSKVSDNDIFTGGFFDKKELANVFGGGLFLPDDFNENDKFKDPMFNPFTEEDVKVDKKYRSFNPNKYNDNLDEMESTPAFERQGQVLFERENVKTDKLIIYELKI